MPRLLLLGVLALGAQPARAESGYRAIEDAGGRVTAVDGIPVPSNAKGYYFDSLGKVQWVRGADSPELRSPFQAQARATSLPAPTTFERTDLPERQSVASPLSSVSASTSTHQTGASDAAAKTTIANSAPRTYDYRQSNRRSLPTSVEILRKAIGGEKVIHTAEANGHFLDRYRAWREGNAEGTFPKHDGSLRDVMTDNPFVCQYMDYEADDFAPPFEMNLVLSASIDPAQADGPVANRSTLGNYSFSLYPPNKSVREADVRESFGSKGFVVLLSPVEAPDPVTGRNDGPHASARLRVGRELFNDIPEAKLPVKAKLPSVVEGQIRYAKGTAKRFPQDVVLTYQTSRQTELICVHR